MVLYPVLVQGEGAAQDIAKAIKYMNDNKCADTSWFDKDNKQYRYSVAHGAAMLRADASDDIIFTNGDYQHSER